MRSCCLVGREYGRATGRHNRPQPPTTAHYHPPPSLSTLPSYNLPAFKLMTGYAMLLSTILYNVVSTVSGVNFHTFVKSPAVNNTLCAVNDCSMMGFLNLLFALIIHLGEW